MRLNIHDQFIVGVVRPSGGWSKGRPIAYIEEDDRCVPLFDLLIPNDLDDEQVTQYVGDKFRAFGAPGGRAPLTQTSTSFFLSPRVPAHTRPLDIRPAAPESWCPLAAR